MESSTAVARSLRASFPHVVAFSSIADRGYHFLASLSPIPDLTTEQFVKRLPENAKRDLMEWNPEISVAKVAENILAGRTQIGSTTCNRLRRLLARYQIEYIG